jgi:hypothetical protein
MAVSAVFQADFGSFFQAVEQSEVKLRALDAGSQNVERSLSRMASSFNGHKIIQDATAMAKIFEDAGGKAAFTDKELARMNATASEAAEKLRAIGQEVPAGLQRLATETKGASTQTEGLTASVKSLALAFVGMFTISAASNFIRGISETAGALADLSAQTQINVEDLQVMGNAMSEFGISTDELGRALFGLSKRIAGGDDAVADALLQMGLSLKELQGMHGEQLFLTIQDGLSKLQGQLRDDTAAALYGDKLGMAMAGAAEGTSKAIEEQRKLANFMTTEMVASIDTAGEHWDRFFLRVEAWAANRIIGPISADLLAFVEVAEKVGLSAAVWSRVDDALRNLAFAADTGNAKFKELAASAGVLTGEQRLHEGAVDALNKVYATYGPQLKSAKDETESMAGTTKRLREEQEKIAETAKVIAREREVAIKQEQARIENLQAETKAEEHALEWKNKVIAWYREKVRVSEEAKAAAAALAVQEAQLEKDYQATVKAVEDTGQAHTEAGAAAVEATQLASAGYVQVAQKAALTTDNARALMLIMRDTAAANAILMENSLFTTRGQLERIAALPMPKFQSGVVNFGGGIAQVHKDELLVNLPAGTSVIPAGRGGGGSSGITVYNTFHLVDTESNLARRVSETILRTVRAGTQLGTT